MWILQSDKVTGTCNESDRKCVRKKDHREKVKTDAMQFGKELQMQSSQYGICKTNMGVKERSSTLLL